jgi:hypothetical protein
MPEPSLYMQPINEPMCTKHHAHAYRGSAMQLNKRRFMGTREQGDHVVIAALDTDRRQDVTKSG